MATQPSNTPPTLDEQMAAQARIRESWDSKGEKKTNNGALTGCIVAFLAVIASFLALGALIGVVGGWLYLL